MLDADFHVSIAPILHIHHRCDCEKALTVSKRTAFLISILHGSVPVFQKKKSLM